jgi:hypothetical protein
MLVKISWSGITNNWCVLTCSSSNTNTYLSVYSSNEYGACIIVAAAYVSVGYIMVDPNVKI